MRLVHNQQRATAVAQARLEKILEPQKKRTLVVVLLLRQAKGRRHHVQKIKSIELGGHDMGDVDVVPVNGSAKPLHQRCFAGADFAGDDNEAFAAVQSVGQVGHRLGVNAALEIETVIRREQKGFATKAIKLRVHLITVLTRNPAAGRHQGAPGHNSHNNNRYRPQFSPIPELY